MATKMVDDDKSLAINFEEPNLKSRWLWLNPKAAGYRKRAQLCMVIVAVTCIMVFTLSMQLLLIEMLSVGRGLAIASLSLFATVIVVWLWSRNQFCNVCGARIKSAFSERALTWCPTCYSLNDVTQLGRLDPIGLRDWAMYEPIPKFLAIATMIAITEGCHEIKFERHKDDFRVFLIRNGETFEMNSPPVFIHFGVAQTIKAIAGLDLKKCDILQEGHIEVKVSRTVETDVVVEPGEFGQNVTLRFVRSQNEACASETDEE